MSFVGKQDDPWTSFSKQATASSLSSSGDAQSAAEAVPLFGSSATSSAGKAADEDDGSGSDDENDTSTDESINDASADASANSSGSAVSIMPSDYVAVTGEENENCLLQLRVKLFRLQSTEPARSVASAEASTKKPSLEWVEVGTGPLRILSQECADSHDESTKHRIVMRRECQAGGAGLVFVHLVVRVPVHHECPHIIFIGTKLLLNAAVSSRLHVQHARQGDKAVRFTCFETIVEQRYCKPDKLILPTTATAANDDYDDGEESPTAPLVTKVTKKTVPTTYLFRTQSTKVRLNFYIIHVFCACLP